MPPARLLAATTMLATCVAATAHAMPAWYEENRAHAHTRLPLSTYCDAATGTCEAVFEHAGADMASIGVRALVRHTHTGNDNTWWPRGPKGAWAPQVVATGRNYARELVEEAHAAGVRLIAYHYPRCHAYFSAANPAWVNKVYNGSEAPAAPRGKTLCINSPWREEYKAELRDLVSFGVDGTYHDEYPQPTGGCWCEYCQKKFKDWSGGLSLPKPSPAGQPLSPEYRTVLEFNTWNVLEYFRDLADTVNDAGAAAIAAGNRTDMPVTLFSLHSLPCADAGGNLYETMRISNASLYSTPKIEYDTGAGASCLRAFNTHASPLYNTTFDADTLTTFGWVMSRDAADGRPPHVWDPNTHTNASDVMCAMTAMMTYGLVANLDHEEKLIPSATLFKDAYALANKLAPIINGTRPRRWAAVVFGEASRDALLPTVPTWNATIWTDVLLPTVGAWEACDRRGVPCAVLSDWQLDEAHLSQYAVVIVPPVQLLPNQTAALAAFQAAGGGVVHLAADAGWGVVSHRPALEAALWQQVSAVARTPPPVALHRKPTAAGDGVAVLPVPVVSHPHAVALAVESAAGAEQLVMVSNGFLWCGKREAASHPAQPPPVTGLSLRVTSSQQPHAMDVVSGHNLTVTSDGADNWMVTLPSFEYLAAVHLSCSGACFAGTSTVV